MITIHISQNPYDAQGAPACGSPGQTITLRVAFTVLARGSSPLAKIEVSQLCQDCLDQVDHLFDEYERARGEEEEQAAQKDDQLVGYRQTRHEILRWRAAMGYQDAIDALRLEYGEEANETAQD